MARELLSPIAILDETHSAVARVAGPWLGLCWISTIPLRLLQVHFIRELGHLGVLAPEYGDHLGSIAWAVLAAFVPAVAGRMVYVRACLLGLQSGARVGKEALHVPPAQLANALYLALLVEVLFFLTVWTFIAIPMLAVPAGLVYAAASRTDRPGLGRPIAEMARLGANLKVVITLVFTFGIALLIAFLNLYFAARGVLWAVEGLVGELPRWAHLLRPFPVVPAPAEPLTFWLCVAGALLVVEPFWLASLAVYVHRARLRGTGEDLRLWFRSLTRAQ